MAKSSTQRNVFVQVQMNITALPPMLAKSWKYFSLTFTWQLYAHLKFFDI